MLNAIRVFTRPLTSAAFDAKTGQFACWFSSAIVLVLGCFKLARLPLNETELFFGILLVLAVSLLGVLMGLVLPISTNAPSRSAQQHREFP